ncbi:glycosyltransferase [Clostridium aminobutyricum]|uniref:Glycosyltransferase n=1 Tax=Clostridium aminobutyricum TaxID=33953 RepID=A0A939IHP5_CLOAM|nr:glycosyltransferase [Clostridium aminobutyricum]MBN7774057.1 glycosyltransferase [Clostridium aminobutyricum]
MKKILYVASTYGHIASFHIPYIKKLQENGFLVDVAAANSNEEAKNLLMKELPESGFIDISFEKKMFSYKNAKAVKQIRKKISNRAYDIISVHTSLASFYVRLAVLLLISQKSLRPILINTVHGYLFDNKTSFLKRSLLLFAEKITRSVTNHLLVMNCDDYEIAQKYHLYQDTLSMIPGMGIDTIRFSQENFALLDRNEERKKLNLNQSDIVMIYAAEFSKRKNQKMLISAIQQLPPNVKLILAGQGDQLEKCKKLSCQVNLTHSTSSREKNSVVRSAKEERIIFLGHVGNLEYYYFISDICVSSSSSEGLPFNIMEAMSMGLPVVATDVKGHKDLIEESINGFLYEFDSMEGFRNTLMRLIELPSIALRQIGENNTDKASLYSLQEVLEKGLSIFNK